jgi:hypothetical protein
MQKLPTAFGFIEYTTESRATRCILMFGFEKAPFFEAPAAAKGAPQVKF